MTHDAAYGARVLRKLADELENPEDLEAEYARLLADKARENAQSRPTPQSAMAADALTVSGNVIRVAGGNPGAVAASSEFGSDIYPQFQHPHTEQGLWLYPAASDLGVLQQTDNALEQLIERVI